jgi:hypothetical protein
MFQGWLQFLVVPARASSKLKRQFQVSLNDYIEDCYNYIFVSFLWNQYIFLLVTHGVLERRKHTGIAGARNFTRRFPCIAPQNALDRLSFDRLYR